MRSHKQFVSFFILAFVLRRFVCDETEGTGAEPAGEKGECVNEWVKAVCRLSSELLFAQSQAAGQ